MSNLAALLAGKTQSPTVKVKGLQVTDPTLVEAAREWIVLDTAVEEAEAARTAHEVIFKPSIRRAFFALNAGRAKPESSVKITTSKGSLTASFAAQWFPKVESLCDIGIPKRLIRRRCSIKIDVDAIPNDKQDDVVGAILKALEEHGCGGALSAKLGDYPTEAFAAERFTAFTPDQNEELEQAGLCTRMSMRR